MKSKSMLCMTLVATGALAAAAADYRPGFREVDGVTVEADGSVQLDGTVAVGDKGRFVKAGDGTLSVSMSQINASGNTRIAVVGGTLAATPGADTTVDLAAPPAVIADKAAFWVNETSVVATNGANNVAYASKWCDVRETNPASPTRIFAMPQWYDGSGSPGTRQGIDPCVETKDGVQAVYFGGASSGQNMRWFSKVGTTVSSLQVRHFFLVHGAYDCWGNVLGCAGKSRDGGFVVGLSATVPSLNNVTAHFPARFDCCPDLMTARFFLDGEYIDVLRVPPKRGFQLLEGCSTTYPFRMDSFFRTSFETFKNAQGGDYIAEAIVFTDLLTEAERLDIERYLMKKWNLPAANGTYTDSNSVVTRNNLPPPTLQVGVASNSVFSYTMSSTDMSRAFAFSGSGTVRVSGSGLTVLGVDDGQPWGGKFEWDGAGGLLAKGGAFPPLDVKGGEAYTCANYVQNSSATAAGDATAGLRLTRSGAENQKVVTFSGNGWTRVRSVSNNVTRLRVDGGIVQLQGRVRDDAVVADGAVEATVPNGDFEEPISPTDQFHRQKLTSSGGNGWYSAENNSHIMDTSATKVSGNGWWSWLSKLPRNGSKRVLQIVQKSGAYTQVRFPKAGFYELSFDARSRYGNADAVNSGNAHQRPQVELRLGDSWSQAVKFGVLTLNNHDFVRYRYRLPYVPAGQKCLGLASIDSGHDACLFVDNVKVTFVPDAEEPPAFKIPYGDVDEPVRNTVAPLSYTAHTVLNRVRGWELSVEDETCKTNCPVAMVGTGNCWRRFTTWLLNFFPARDLPLGSGALSFVSTGGSARTTFTAPAGSFRLQARACTSSFSGHMGMGSSEKGFTGNGSVHAYLTKGDGSVVDLGQVSVPNSWLTPETVCWTQAIELDQDQIVTLELRQDNATGTAVVDDLAFVASSRIRSGNLIQDPGFERSDVWTTGNTPHEFVLMPDRKPGSTQFHAWNQNQPWAFGYNVFEGKRYLRIMDGGRASCSVNVPDAGLYRLSFETRTRIDSVNRAGNNFRIWLQPQSDGSVTNEVARFADPYARDWHKVSFLVDIAQAGNHTLYIDGLGAPSGLDRNGCFDNVALEKVVETIDPAPDIPSDLKIDVADDARLVLDYVGVAKSGRVRYKGRSYTGLLSAKTNPEFISGAGSLNAVAAGTLFILR